MKTLRGNWLVFSSVPEDMDDSLTLHMTYREAVLEAQSRHLTVRRPKRELPGIYKVSGENHSSFVVSRKAFNDHWSFRV